MQKHRVNNTDILVSAIGLGTVKFGRNTNVKYPHAFQLPSDAEIRLLLNTAKNLGVNFLDTAPAYGESEKRIGSLLKNERHDWVIMSKAGETFVNNESRFDFSRHALLKSVENSLRQLQTDYIDILLIHSNGDDEWIIKNCEVFETLKILKNSGKIRVFGMSTKTIAGGLLTVSEADAAMIAFNPFYTDERAVIAAAHEQQKSIFIKKAFASGHLSQLKTDQPIDAVMRCIWQEPGVTSIIAGTINPTHLEENVHAASAVLSTKNNGKQNW